MEAMISRNVFLNYILGSSLEELMGIFVAWIYTGAWGKQTGVKSRLGTLNGVFSGVLLVCRVTSENVGMQE